MKANVQWDVQWRAIAQGDDVRSGVQPPRALGIGQGCR